MFRIVLLAACLVVSHAWRVTIEPTGEEAGVKVSIVNTFDSAVTLCTWNSPLDANSEVFRAKLFAIESPAEQEPTYIGILARKHPTLSDFITLQPGQTVQTTLNLFNGYHFPVTGEYKVAMNTLVQFTFDELDFATLSTQGLSNFEYQPMTSNAISVQIDTLLPAPVWGPAPNGTLGNPAPRANCNTGTYVSQLNTAGNNAISQSTTAINYLSPSSCSSSMSYYTTWFGACDSSRYSTVKNCIPKIRSGLQASFPVDCSNASPCTSNTVAYVYPADSGHVVYVCAYFWRYPGTNCVLDSQPGTLVHEMSHFNNVCGTGDVTYGQANCKNLASTRPNEAVRNAANYHYFTESCPR